MLTLLDRLRALTFYSVDPESGGGGPAAPVAPEAPPADAGTPQGQPQEDGFWGRFPNVPTEQRALLEPHLKQVQGYVTQLQQRYSPFKDYTNEQVQGLAKFAQDFETNPLGMWLTLAQSLQESGAIHGELDLEALAEYAQGRFDEEPPEPVAPPNGTPTDDMPEWAKRLETRIEQQERERQETQQRTQQQAEDRLFQQKFGVLKTNLKEAGLPEDLFTDADLTAFIVATKGDFAAAEQRILNMRTGLLKGFVEDKSKPELEIANGGPQARTPPNGRRAPRDGFEAASISAEQYLKQNLRAGAQE